MRRDAPPPRVLQALDLVPDDLLGEGGEAWVYALDPERVARVHRGSADESSADARARLLAELGRGSAAVPFAIPRVLEIRRVEDAVVTIEERLPGEPLRRVLERSDGEARQSLVRRYLDAAERIADLPIDRPWFGELCQPRPIRASSWRAWLEARARHSLRAAGEDFAAVDPRAIAADLPSASTGELVHLDAFPGNMLCDGEQITAVIDFGAVTLIGDRRLDPLTAAVYLQPPMTPGATADDLTVARAWLAERSLDRYFEAAERWAAAFWSFAADDTSLYAWCGERLLRR